MIEATGVEVRLGRPGHRAPARARRGRGAPRATLASIRDERRGAEGAGRDPGRGAAFATSNVALRQELDLFANIRPCRRYPGVPSVYEDVDLVVVRENIEDTYTGIEFEVGTVEVEAS